MSNGVRFAPSPTGTFHLGNLRTAWVSYVLAKRLNEPWIVRFEDIDGPRVVAGAQQAQLADLETLGMIPDQISVQSRNHARHLALFERARTQGVLYPCTCSRREVQTALSQMSSASHIDSSHAPVYNGHCRHRSVDLAKVKNRSPVAWRFRMRSDSGTEDFIAARTSFEDAREAFAPSYHWACAIDDFDGDYRLIVRAIDLEAALGPQRAIQLWMNEEAKRAIAYPAVFHTSLVTRDDGGRLEKRSRGVTLRELIDQGFQPAELVQKLTRSFSNLDIRFEAGEIMKETRTSIRVEEILAY